MFEWRMRRGRHSLEGKGGREKGQRIDEIECFQLDPYTANNATVEKGN
jgi:hypothetical protein